MNTLEQEIKDLIVEALMLEDVNPDEIDSEAPLFGEGLGLDSIDALELAIALDRKFKVKINADDPNTRETFRSVKSLAAFVQKHRSETGRS
jgi:acyl carrier protein